MAKTRSQTRYSAIKNADNDGGLKGSRLLRDLRNKTKMSSKKNKRNATRNENSLSSISQVKLEEEETNKNLLLESNSRNNQTTAMAIKDRVEQFFGYIINDKMSIPTAARKAKISHTTAYKYYMRYKNDPERNIPISPVNKKRRIASITQEKIKELIDYIDIDKMSVSAASVKAKMSEPTAHKYYKLYNNDPERNIPVPTTNYIHHTVLITQDQVNKVITYIVDDKMSINAAAIKSNMSATTARTYYLKYLHSRDHNIPIVKKDFAAVPKPTAQDQVKALIEYIVNDKMSIEIASIKAGMHIATARKYYSLYLNDPNHQIPNPESRENPNITDRRINNLIRYIITDKLSVAAAARKVKIMPYSAYYYYKRYKTKRKVPTHIRKCNLYTQEQMKKLVDYVESDKLSIRDAAEKVKMNYNTARNHISNLRKKSKQKTDQQSTFRKMIKKENP